MAKQRRRIDTDAHRGEFQRGVEHGVPDQDVTVEAAEAVRCGSGPIVVVGGAAIVTRAVGEGAADAAKFLGVHKGDLAGQRGRDVWEGAVRHGLGGQQGAVDAADDVVKEVHRAILRADSSLPVPLIDVERVDVIQLLVGADSVHVRVEPLAGRDAVGGQLHALPFGQRVHHLGTSVAHVFDGERYGALHAVEVVVQT